MEKKTSKFFCGHGVYSYTQGDLHFGGLWADGFCPTNSHADPAQAGPTVIGENGLEELDTTNTDCLPPQLLAVTTVLEV